MAVSWICGCVKQGFLNMDRGVGTNFSNIRGEGEKLSGGGTSSGLMSFLKMATVQQALLKAVAQHAVQPKWFALIWIILKSLNFINWKVEEEKKVAALIACRLSQRL